MKVLLTGANGFVGSHILEILLEMNARVAVLLRPGADCGFISHNLKGVKIHRGGLDDPGILEAALHDMDAVIHCAGKTKALKLSEYDVVNGVGTRKIVAAANTCRHTLKHLIYISSLAVSGPGDLQRPAREIDPPRPVSAYGRSKLRGEEAVIEQSRVPWTILRPAAVYGPRDTDFYHAFLSVKRRIMPLIDGGERPLSLIYVRDVAESVRDCLTHPEAAGKIFHVAAAPPCTDKVLLEEIAGQMRIRPLRLNLPSVVLYPVCLVNDWLSRLTGRPQILNYQKVAELRAPGWVCDTDRIRSALGFSAETTLPEGVRRTHAWYRRQGWL